MPLKTFERNDIFYNTIITKPSYSIRIFNSTSSINNSDGFITLHKLNITGNNDTYYPYIDKTSTDYSFKTIDSDQYNRTQYGSRLIGSYPYTSSIDIKFIQASTDPQCLTYNSTILLSDGTIISDLISERVRIKALKNTLNYYSLLSPHYFYSSSYGDKSTQRITLIGIPSILYGSCINKGSVSLSYYITGTLVAKLEDYKKNGELIQTTSSAGIDGSGSVAGVILYNEGFIVLTGSWTLCNHLEQYEYCPAVSFANPKWIYWGASYKELESYTTASTFGLNFETTNKIQSITMLAHAKVGELNHSNNSSIIKYGQDRTSLSSSTTYIEKSNLEIVNLVSSSYSSPTGSFDKITYISKIGIYDKDKNLIAIAKTKVPLKKTEARNYIVKLKYLI